MATLMETRYLAFSMLWYADDPGSNGRASVAGDRLHGHAPRFSVVGTPGAGLLSGIDWRNPQEALRPTRVG
jgi:hypothetical protein